MWVGVDVFSMHKRRNGKESAQGNLMRAASLPH